MYPNHQRLDLAETVAKVLLVRERKAALIDA
jgi:hypothetical protein